MEVPFSGSEPVNLFLQEPQQTVGFGHICCPNGACIPFNITAAYTVEIPKRHGNDTSRSNYFFIGDIQKDSILEEHFCSLVWLSDLQEKGLLD